MFEKNGDDYLPPGVAIRMQKPFILNVQFYFKPRFKVILS